MINFFRTLLYYIIVSIMIICLVPIFVIGIILLSIVFIIGLVIEILINKNVDFSYKI